MPGAYLLINALPGMEKTLVDAIAEIPGVISVEGVYGDFDLIARVEVPVGNTIGPVIDAVRKLDGVKSTRTVSTIDGERKSGTAIEFHGSPSD
ncbi:MAG: Lrp/AsnC ligand binding domain-containing protein [Nitrososphaera sp.]|jgi:DNA-binding Lrp family transcriptional regulator